MAPILIHPDPQQPFLVEIDASDFAVGCVPNQRDKEGDEYSCAFYSHDLNTAEDDYCRIYGKERLAIKVGFEEWRWYLERAPHQVTVLSDQKGLEFLATANIML